MTRLQIAARKASNVLHGKPMDNSNQWFDDLITIRKELDDALIAAVGEAEPPPRRGVPMPYPGDDPTPTPATSAELEEVAKRLIENAVSDFAKALREALSGTRAGADGSRSADSAGRESTTDAGQGSPVPSAPVGEAPPCPSAPPPAKRSPLTAVRNLSAWFTQRWPDWPNIDKELFEAAFVAAVQAVPSVPTPWVPPPVTITYPVKEKK